MQVLQTINLFLTLDTDYTLVSVIIARFQIIFDNALRDLLDNVTILIVISLDDVSFDKTEPCHNI